MGDQSQDPVVRALRERISETDLAVLEAVNRRLELVGRLHEHKRAQGYALVDTARERALLDDLARANTGPLSAGGLRELFTTLLALTKREIARDAVASADGAP